MPTLNPIPPSDSREKCGHDSRSGAQHRHRGQPAQPEAAPTPRHGWESTALTLSMAPRLQTADKDTGLTIHWHIIEILIPEDSQSPLRFTNACLFSLFLP